MVDVVEVDNKREQTLKSIARTIRQAENDAEKMVKILDLVPDEVLSLVSYVSTFRDLSVGIPWDVSLEDRILSIFLANGWQLKNSRYYDRSGSRIHDLNHESTGNTSSYFPDMQLSVNPDKPGSKCEKIQVGTVEVPIYEVTCTEDA
jgi:hypothetical protein